MSVSLRTKNLWQTHTLDRLRVQVHKVKHMCFIEKTVNMFYKSANHSKEVFITRNKGDVHVM